MTEHRAQGVFAVLMLTASALSLIVFPLVDGVGRVIVPAVCSVLSFAAVGILLAGRRHGGTNRASTDRVNT